MLPRNSFPEGQGTAIWKFLSVPANIKRLQKGLEHIRLVEKSELGDINKQVMRLDIFKQEIASSIQNLELLRKGQFVSQVAKFGFGELNQDDNRFEDWKTKILEGQSSEDDERYQLKLFNMNAYNVYWPSISRDTGAE